MNDCSFATQMKGSMNKSTLIVLLLFSKTLFACECPTLQPISKELSSAYNAIFLGKVDSVSAANAKGICTAYFTINELYKGNIQQHVKVDFDALSECMMSFEVNEQWLMYCTYQMFDVLNVNICSHSRKLFDVTNGEQDFYQLASQRTFEEEKLFLHTTLSIQPFGGKNEMNQQQIDFRPHNDQPSATNKLLLLLSSFAVMLMVYFITRKKNK